MIKSFARIGFLAIVVAGIGAMVACSDDDDPVTPPTGSDGGNEAAATETGTNDLPGSVSGTATYNGTKKGPLYLTVYPSFPPVGAPSGIGAVNTPTWPGSNAFKITNVNPGSYVVLSYISVGTDHNMGPQPGDPVSQPVPVTIESNKEAKADIVLGDIPEDAGADGSEDASGDAPSDG